jgi:hypothetical protein
MVVAPQKGGWFEANMVEKRRRPSCWVLRGALSARWSVRLNLALEQLEESPWEGTMKHCPYCTAEIPDEAAKCMHCGEWVEGKGASTQQTRQQTLNIRVEPTEFQKTAFKRVLLVVIILGIIGLVLLRPVAEVPPQAPEAFGLEVKLRDQIQGWLKERKLDGKRFKGFERGGEVPGGALGTPDRYFQIGGLQFEDGQVVNYRLTLVRADCQTGQVEPLKTDFSPKPEPGSKR